MDVREQKSDTLKAIELILKHEGLRQAISGMANDSYKPPEFILGWIREEFFTVIPDDELKANFTPGKAYIDFKVIVAVFTEAETYAKTHEWKLVEK